MSYRQQLRFPRFLEKAFTISYDDGTVTDERLISLMGKYSIRGTFNIMSSSFISENGDMDKETAIKRYGKDLTEVAIHGREHLSLTEVAPALVTGDVLYDRLALEDMFNTTIKGMAYANGSYNDGVIKILEVCGIDYARTVKSTEAFFLPDNWLEWHPTCHHGNPRLMELARIFTGDEESEDWRLNLIKPKLFYVWGHSSEFEGNNNWEIIEELFSYIGNRDDVWYATNGEIFNYVKAYESLIKNAKGDVIYNPTLIDVYLNIENKNILVKSGDTVRIAD